VDATASPIADITASLQDALGEELVAFMVEVEEPWLAGQWASGRCSPKNPDVERKLSDAHQIFRLLVTTESPATVRAWFVGPNHQRGTVHVMS
jgi:hypothetical protein